MVAPVWHYTICTPLRVFLNETDLSGKTVYVVTTHRGSGFADVPERIREMEPKASVVAARATTRRSITTQSWNMSTKRFINEEEKRMKRIVMILMVSLLTLSLVLSLALAEGDHRVAKDGAQMQTDDPTMPTRVPMEGGTKILLHFGDTVIPGVLNDSETAQALIAKLPYTQHMSRYSHDFCGVTENLPYNADEEHYGWLNGDIDYATDAPYFTILFEDQDESEIYGNQVNIGVITCPLAEIAALEGSYDVLIELDQ